MAIDVLVNYVEGTVTSGGTTTSDTAFTVDCTGWPALVSGQQIKVMDKADLGLTSGYEIMDATYTATPGSGVAWTVTRGAEGSTAHAHTSDWTVVPATTAANMTSGRLLGSCSYAPSIPVSSSPSSLGVLLPMDPVNLTSRSGRPPRGPYGRP